MNSNVLLGVAIAAFVVLSLIFVSSSQALARGKFAAFAIDTTNGRVLYSRNGDARRYPASLTKMMTLYLLFEDMEKRLVNAASRFAVSRHAAAQQPSKLGLRPGQSITALDAIRALVTLSANDVAVVIAENRSGSEAVFAARMTRTARLLGMHHTRFRNASGLPDRHQYTTARDMAKLGAALQARFPDRYRHFQMRSFTYQGRAYRTHNHLLGRVSGVDGIKTGYINASGFNIAVSLKRGARKVVAVVMGGRTAKSRDAFAVALVQRVISRAQPGQGYYRGLLAAMRRASPPSSITQVERSASLPLKGASTLDAGQGDAATAGGEYIIQLGALSTKDAALGVIERARPYVLRASADAKPLAQRVGLDGKTLFRARFGGFSNLESAREACIRLKAAQLSCFATTP